MKVFNVVLFCLYIGAFHTAAWAGLVDNYWIVKRGDTLYKISRSIYPKSTLQQSKLRKAIIQLNQGVFKKGSGSLYVGAKLRLPELPSVSSSVISKNKSSVTAVKKKEKSTVLTSNRWKVKYGNSLYSIAKIFFPRSNKRQFKLRQDIVRLNPDVFNNGRNKMEVGYVLILPDYLITKKDDSGSVSSKSVEKRGITEKKSTDINKLSENENSKNNVTQYMPHSRYASKISLSLGYSFGGDSAQQTQGGHDITYGSGAHLRLNYDGLWRNRQGYRIGIGYQYDKVTADNGSAQLEQAYLQAMYLYNQDDSLLGIGVSYHDNIFFKQELNAIPTNTISYEFYEPATGVILMYEYKRLFGNNILGIAYTALESEDTVNMAKKDLSITELYYRLSF